MNKDWDPNLTPEQNYVLKQEGTESPGSSPLNQEKREGSYHCVGCGTKLFESSTKYESGSGWPSFFESIPGVFEEKKRYAHRLSEDRISLQKMWRSSRSCI